MEKSGLEKERKFLIEKYHADIADEIRWDIVQTYLYKTSPDIQRRIRRITADKEKVSYFYTEKKFISDGVREENEKEIPESEYNRLLSDEADRSLVGIAKTRRIFDRMGHRFEMDEYPFSDKYATVEAELADINEEIVFPDFLTVIKEVTGDERYSNANLALRRAFPDEE